jgi:hypothetical protein
MGRADRIQAEFPPDITMPDQLRRLCNFLDRTDYPLSGNMMLCPEDEGLEGWFGADSAAWNQLAGFGERSLRYLHLFGQIEAVSCLHRARARVWSRLGRR